MVIRTCHELEALKLIDLCHRQRFTSFIDLTNHLLDLRDISLRLCLLGETQEALEAASLIFKSAKLTSSADHFGIITVVFFSLFIHLIEIYGHRRDSVFTTTTILLAVVSFALSTADFRHISTVLGVLPPWHL